MSGGAANVDAVLGFCVLGQTIVFDCDDAAVARLLLAASPGLRCADPANPSLRYSVQRAGDPLSFIVSRAGGPTLTGHDAAEFLFLLEKDLTVELQHRRPDLLFLHAAALEWQGRAYLLVADSGVGKSTTAWALLHEGLGYLSDELAPVDLDAMQVLPYPHALCLKAVPDDYALPAEAVDLGATIHVPPPSLPGGAVHEPTALAAVFILSRPRGTAGAARLRRLGAAEAAARLYTHTLNALAHRNRGLDAVVRIAERVPCFAVASGELRATCALIRAKVENRQASDYVVSAR